MFGFLKKKVPAGLQQPASGRDSDRYTGRPLLVVLESYVLDCIDSLSPEKQATVRAIVDKVWGGGPDWKASIREQLQLEKDLDEALRGMWLRNQELARQHGEELLAEDFAKMVVDENFAHLLS